jgi:hypothetical protein
MNAALRDDFKQRRRRRDRQAAAGIATHMRQVEVRRVIRTVGVDVKAVPLAPAIRHGHRTPFAHADIIAKKRRIHRADTGIPEP